jgi:hypothetical protein
MAALLRDVNVAANFAAVVSMSVSGATPSDGFLFVLHNDPRGRGAKGDFVSCLSYTSDQVANPGGGVRGCSGPPGIVVTPSVAVGVSVYAGCLRLGVGGSFLLSTCFSYSFSPGTYTLRVAYDAPTLQLSAALYTPAGALIPGAAATWTLSASVEALVQAPAAILGIGGASGFFPTAFTLTALQWSPT